MLFSVPILSVAMVMSPCLGDRSNQLDVSRVVGVRRAVALRVAQSRAWPATASQPSVPSVQCEPPGYALNQVTALDVR
jgi:hypothetical protein